MRGYYTCSIIHGGVYYSGSIIHEGVYYTGSAIRPPCIIFQYNTPPHVLYSKYNTWLSIRAVFPITIFTVLTYINVVIIQILLSPPSTPVSLPGPVRYIRFAIIMAIHVKNLYNIYQFFNNNLTFSLNGSKL